MCVVRACVCFAATIIGFLTCCLVGLDSTRLTWNKFIEETKGRWSALALDQRGWGESPLGKEQEYSAAIVAADIERALQEEVGDRKVVLVGHSMGGCGVWLVWGGRREGAAFLGSLVGSR